MEIAIFTESYEPTMGSKRRQVLMAPCDGEVRIWSRVTDGSKGPHNKWEDASLADSYLILSMIDEQLTRTASWCVCHISLT
jgi:hypothetical protein